VCCGATPIGMVDHLQFGSPEDPEIFWTFLESLKGITDFAKSFKIPCVGGKVSFYNETPKGPIKPTPLIGVLGIIDKSPLHPLQIKNDDVLVIVGKTKNELGGSEYLEYIHSFIGGKCPKVDFETSKKNMDSILTVIRKDLVKCAHDCSKGGIAIAISELCMINNIGCKISLENIPSEKLQIDRLLFSESHSRYLIVTTKNNLEKIKNILSERNVDYGIIGNFGGNEIIFEKDSKKISNLSVDKTRLKWMNSLEELVLHG
jgi:phosphoribosylformylglycinamidine synthase